MDKDVRNAIERATQKARRLLEEDFAEQLDATYDVRADGRVAEKGGAHLTGRQHLLRDKIVAAIEHKRSAAMKPKEAVADYIRDAAFTALNRFVALKMLEARELVQECISRGDGSSGFAEFCGLAPAIKIANGAGYRLYIESIFDELSTEVKVLFDRRDAASVLWPKKATFDELLAILNANELKSVWSEDETIGWVYQYFNSGEERRKMRDESQAPRNSRELAIRNQFFTPRYIVQFLCDNTLGRIWYEMRNGNTKLANVCEYLIQQPGENARSKKDPRDITVIDPACGSGHFLLYCFILLLMMYEEAWADDTSPKSRTTGETLRHDYPSLDELHKAAPGLILQNNIHGIDIDPRCAQIAQLALWMRSQRAFKEAHIPRSERPIIRKANIVIAEPMPGDRKLVEQFAATLQPAIIGGLFKEIVSEMRLAGEMGFLLPLQQKLAVSIEEACKAFVKQQRQVGNFLPGLAPIPRQKELDLSGIDNSAFFEQAETKIFEALSKFVSNAVNGVGVRRRLFADDAEQGIAFVELMSRKFDVMLMNPPFGDANADTVSELAGRYPTWGRNLLCAFILHAKNMLCDNGLCGSVIDRTINEKSTYEGFRQASYFSQLPITRAIDLGWSVLDANVEVGAVVLASDRSSSDKIWCLDLRQIDTKSDSLRSRIQTNDCWFSRSAISRLPNAVLGYFFPPFVTHLFETYSSLKERGFDFFEGHTLKSERYFRLIWECPITNLGKRWIRLFNGTPYSRYAYPHHDVVAFGNESGISGDDAAVLRNSKKHKKQGVCFGKRGEFIDAQIVPDGFVSTVEGKVCIAPDSSELVLLAIMNSQLFQLIINQYTGQHKYSGYVELLPIPSTSKFEHAAKMALEIFEKKWSLFALLEISPNFNGLWKGSKIIDPEILFNTMTQRMAEIEKLEDRLNEAVISAYGLDTQARETLAAYSVAEPKSAIPYVETVSNEYFAEMILQFAMGIAFGRWLSSPADISTNVAPFDPLPWTCPAQLIAESANELLIDDPGMDRDIVANIEKILGAEKLVELTALLGMLPREYFRASASKFHLDFYSVGSRSGPVYWQLATASGGYSVWLYIHAFSKDTLFRIQSDNISVKLAHEQRQLNALRAETASNASTKQLKEIEQQETFVAELQMFLDEVKHVAPLWDPSLDDGVVITAAPLWRLFPQNKSWQKELKDTWDSLCRGDYDWAHLALHLWPERVIPKCAEDRSLAIAHGLEEVFWFEDEDGKWKPHEKSLKSITKLVNERTSTAVKAALKSLLDAPELASGAKRSRKSKTA